MGHKQSKRNDDDDDDDTNNDTDYAQLLVIGFLRRELTRNGFDPAAAVHNSLSLCAICSSYYTPQKLVFLCDKASFHCIDMTHPHQPLLLKDVVPFNVGSQRISQYAAPFDLACFIPDVLRPGCHDAITTYLATRKQHPWIIDGHSYDGLFCRSMCSIEDSGESSRSLYIFRRSHHGDDYTDVGRSRIRRNAIDGAFKSTCSSSSTTITSPMMNRGKLLNFATFTDARHGIVGSGGTSVPILYGLSLSDVADNKFVIREISDAQNAEETFGRHRGYLRKQYLTLQYMPDKAQLFAVQCRQEHGHSQSKQELQQRIITANCGVYDLEKNWWHRVTPIRFHLLSNDDEDNFRCGLAYNGSDTQRIYCVSNLGRTATYDFHKHCWNLLYENHSNGHHNEMRFDRGPIAWCYDYMPRVLYCLGAKLSKEKDTYTLCCKRLDARADKRKWTDCLPHAHLDQINQINFHHFFE